MTEFGAYLANQLLAGAQVTIILFLGCAVVGNLLAIPVALARLSNRKWLRYPAVAFILAFRGTPLLVQLYLCYFGIGQILSGIPSIRYSPLWPILRGADFYAFFTLSLNTAAYCGEIWRGRYRPFQKGSVRPANRLACRKHGS